MALRALALGLGAALTLALPLAAEPAQEAPERAGEARTLLPQSLEESSRVVQGWERVIASEPDDAEAHFRLGLALCDHVDHVSFLEKLGVARRLREELETAVDLEPAHVGARIALIEFHRQAPPIAGGDRDEVRRHADELVALVPIEGRLALARMLAKYGEVRAAERQVRHVLGVHPAHRDALLLLARLAEDVGRSDEALAVLRALVARDPGDAEARRRIKDLTTPLRARDRASETGRQARASEAAAPVGTPGPG